jgi:hypothetical protein
MGENFRMTVFIVAAVFAGVLLLLLFFYSPLKAFLFRHNVSRVYYHKVMKIARYNDYYLINDLSIKVGGNNFTHIDHILAGNKFIYVITDCYFDGAIGARREDQSWVYYLRGGKKEFIPNPLLVNRTVMERLSIFSRINSSYFVGIVLVNDDAFVTPFDNVEGEPIFTPLSRLNKVVASYEKRDVEPFSDIELHQVVADLHALGEKDYEQKH